MCDKILSVLSLPFVCSLLLKKYYKTRKKQWLKKKSLSLSAKWQLVPLVQKEALNSLRAFSYSAQEYTDTQISLMQTLNQVPGVHSIATLMRSNSDSLAQSECRNAFMCKYM